MKKYKGEGWTLYNADCLEVCKKAPDNYFSNITTDPPYCLESIAKRFGKKGSAAAKHGKDGAFGRLSKNFLEQSWDDDIVFKVSTWKEFYRVIKPGGIVLSFAADQNYHKMATAAEKAGFKIKRIIGWLYGTGMVHGLDIEKVMAKKGRKAGKYKGYGTALKPAIEPIMVAIKPLSEKTILENLDKWGTAGIYNIAKCRIPDPKKPKYPTNIIHDGSDYIASNGNFIPSYFYCPKPSKKEKGDTLHPTKKPIALMRYLIRLTTPPGGKIFEPFAGSGTTMQAAIEEGFKVVGCEMTSKYIPEIRKRLKNAK